MRLPIRAIGRTVVALLLVLAGLPSDGARAQQNREPVPEVTRTLAVRNAHVVTRPGTQLDRATVVIRDGLILAVGIDAPIPYDARIIEGDSLWVYAGFIDAMSTAGVPEPERNRSPESVPNPAEPPPERAGIRPDRDVRSLLDPDEASVAVLRSAGFGAAHTTPRDGMLSGSGALILLGGSEERTIVRGEVSAVARWDGASDVYPATPMGIAATLRQLVRETRRRQDLEARYDRNPTGMSPPPWDAVHDALAPVAAGIRPLFFEVDTAVEAHRAMALAEDLDLRLVLAGLSEGFELTDRLAESNVPLVVTLALPEKPDWMSKVKADSLDAILASFDPEDRPATYRDLEAERAALRARQAWSCERYVRNASLLREAGLRFGFGTMGAKPADVAKNLQAIVDAGLQPEAALAALTIDGAEILGQTATLGSIEPGKIGNLVLVSGPLFADGSEIRHTVIAGTLFDAERPAADGPGAGGFVGTWSVTVQTPDGPVSGTIRFTGTGDDLEARVTYPALPNGISIPEVDVEGDTVRFSFYSPDGYVAMELTRSGDTVSGTASSDDTPGMSVTGTRGPSDHD